MESHVEIFQMLALSGKVINATIATMFMNVKKKMLIMNKQEIFKKKN